MSSNKKAATKIKSVHLLTVTIYRTLRVEGFNLSKEPDEVLNIVLRFDTKESLNKMRESIVKQLDSGGIDFDGKARINVGPDDYEKCESIENRDLRRVTFTVNEDIEEIDPSDPAFKEIIKRLDEIRRKIDENRVVTMPIIYPQPVTDPYPQQPWRIPPVAIYYGVTAYAVSEPGRTWEWVPSTKITYTTSTNQNPEDATTVTHWDKKK